MSDATLSVGWRAIYLTVGVLSFAAAACAATNDGGLRVTTRDKPAPRAPARDSAAGEPDFLKGGDVSLLQKIEGLGGVYKHDGKPRDPLSILKAHGCNCMRLRLFHSPNGKGPVCNDLAYTLKLGRRIKAAGLRLLLDLHYSDTWADPGHQTTPAAWRTLTFEQLERAVFEYTRDAVAALRKADALPDAVQLGNEITPGMLWPLGRVGGKFNTPEQWRRLAALLRAGARGVKAPLAKGQAVRIMIHIDRGGSVGGTRWFFDHLLEQGVDFDLIGLSYYPWWHGSLDDLRANLAATARRYRKPIVLVETAFPWTARHMGAKKELPVPYPSTPAGQRAFLAAVIRLVRRTPDGLGRGVLYWAPEWIAVRGMGSPWGTKALFETHGNALPALTAFEE